MPAKNTLTPILGGKYYHIFNRGNNHQKTFYTTDNYYYFLKLLSKNLSPYLEILAYSLLPNHFHLLIKAKDDIINTCNKTHKDIKLSDSEIGLLISNQFRRLFISYTQAINKQENRDGNLFAPKFKKLEITCDEYLKYLIFYINYNPEKHNCCKDFRLYKFSSYKAIVSSSITKLSREHVLKLFGGKEEFINYHKCVHSELKELLLE